MKIRTKLMILFLVPIILLGLISVGILLLNRSFYLTTAYVNNSKVTTAKDMRYFTAETSHTVLSYILMHSEKDIQNYQIKSAKLLATISRYKNFPLTDTEQAYLDELLNELNRKMKVEQNLFEVASQRMKNIKLARVWLYNKIDPLLNTEWIKNLKQNDIDYQVTITLLKQINLNINRIISDTRGYMLYRSPELHKMVQENSIALQENLKKLTETNLNNQEVDWLKRLNEYVSNFIPLMNSNLLLEEKKINLLMQDEAINNRITTLQEKLINISVNQLNDKLGQITWLNYGSLLGITTFIALSLFLSWLFAKKLLAPLLILKSAIGRIRKGEDVTITRTTDDEIGEVTEVFQKMVDENKINSAKVSEQTWLKENISDLLSLVQKEITLESLCNTVITKLSTLFKAGCGAFYLVQENDNSKVLVLVSSYAYKNRKNISNTFGFGEGIVGQAALEKTPIELTEIPDDYITVTSGLGNKKPSYIIVYPVSLEKKVLGVIELALFHNLTEIQHQFLHQFSNYLAVALEAIRSHQITEDALKKVQIQSEELQAQQEELRTSNEELEEKTRHLQLSEEELKTQSEELQSANVELEEKMQSIEAQNKIIEQKNIELGKTKLDLEEKAKSLTQAGKYKTEFLSNMSHELRTPLNSLLLLSKSFAQNEDGNLTQRQIEEANIIYKSGNDLLSLINDILDLSKVEAGKLNIEIEKTNIQNIIEDLERQFSSLAKSKGINFEIKMLHHFDTLDTDSHRLKQILRNLISNAIKFTKQGSVVVKITEKNINNDQYIVFNVIDTGIGIPKEKHQEIFESFQQAYGNTDRVYGGTGLGLTISRELAKLLGGEIQLDSKPGEGSTFSLILPLHNKAAAKAKKEIAAAENMSEPEIASLTDDDKYQKESSLPIILIVEKDATFLKDLMQLVRKKGYYCITALNSQTGVLLAKKYLPAGIILDLDSLDNEISLVDVLAKDQTTQNIPIHVISSNDKENWPKKISKINLFKKPTNLSEYDAIFEHFPKPQPDAKIKVLLIEDEQLYQDKIKKAAEEKQIEIIGALTGEEGIEKLEANQFDGIIVDLKLPDMDGHDLLKTLSMRNDDLPPVIIYSGKDLTQHEFEELNQYTSKIVLKEGEKSITRLLNECSLFLHSVTKRKSFAQKQKPKMIHEADGVLRDKKVMVVDDDMRNVYAVSSLLQRQGMQVTASSNGQEALNKLENNFEPHIILMDIMMPILDGYETIKLIRAQKKYQDVPIIAVTAKAMPEDRKSCLDAGANDYITKPIDDQKLLAMLRIWLSK